MPNTSIVFDPEVSDRQLDREVSKINQELEGVGQIDVQADAPELGTPEAGAMGGGGGGLGDDGMDQLGAISEGVGALGGKLPASVGAVTASAALPVAMAGAVGAGMLSAMTSASARLQGSLSILGTAWDMFWRPLGDNLDKLLIRDVAEDILESTSNFEELFREGRPIEGVEALTTGADPRGRALEDRLGGILGSLGGALAGGAAGAKAGAAGGAAIGSIIPGAGTAAGGTAGAIGGAIVGAIGGAGIGGRVGSAVQNALNGLTVSGLKNRIESAASGAREAIEGAASDLKTAIGAGVDDLQAWVKNFDVEEFISSAQDFFHGAIDLGQWMFSGAITLGQWLFHGAIGLGQWLFRGGIGLGRWLFDEATSISWADIQWAGSIALDALEWSGAIMADFFKWRVNITEDLFNWSITITEDFINWAGGGNVQSGAAGGRVTSSGLANIHKGEILADPDRLVNDLATAIDGTTDTRRQSTSGGDVDMQETNDKLDRLHRDLQNLRRAFNVVLNVDGETLARTSENNRQESLLDTDPTTG